MVCAVSCKGARRIHQPRGSAQRVAAARARLEMGLSLLGTTESIRDSANASPKGKDHLLYAVHAPPLPLVTITNFCQAIGHKHEEFARLERY